MPAPTTTLPITATAPTGAAHPPPSQTAKMRRCRDLWPAAARGLQGQTTASRPARPARPGSRESNTPGRLRLHLRAVTFVSARIRFWLPSLSDLVSAYSHGQQIHTIHTTQPYPHLQGPQWPRAEQAAVWPSCLDLSPMGEAPGAGGPADPAPLPRTGTPRLERSRAALAQRQGSWPTATCGGGGLGGRNHQGGAGTGLSTEATDTRADAAPTCLGLGGRRDCRSPSAPGPPPCTRPEYPLPDTSQQKPSTAANTAGGPCLQRSPCVLTHCMGCAGPGGARGQEAPGAAPPGGGGTVRTASTRAPLPT